MSQDELESLNASTRVYRAAPRGVRNSDAQIFSGAAIACTRAQLATLLSIILCTAGLSFLFPRPAGATAHALLFLGFMAAATWRLIAVALAPDQAQPTPQEINWPRYTVIVPLYREAEMIPQIVSALDAIDYPSDRLQVLITLEADDLDTMAAVRRAVLPPCFEVVIAPPGIPRTKPRACNVALDRATGDLLVIYDAEDRPSPGQLKEAAARFGASSRRIACLQAPLRVDPAPGFLGRQFGIEYAVQFEIMIPALARLKAPFPLGGTSNHFRTDALRTVGGWDAFNVTEDADVGFRLAARGYRLGAISQPTWEAPADRMADWLPQRTRWVKGYMQTWGVHMRQPLAGGWGRFAALQATLGLSILSSLLHGPVVVWIALQLLMSSAGLDWIALTHADLAVLITGWTASSIAAVAGARRAGYPIQLLDLVLAPAYWPLLSLAACRAMHQLVVKPFHWDKTRHRPCAGRVEAETAIERA